MSNREHYTFTPNNIIKKGTILGFPWRRWVDAAILVVLTLFIIRLIPFVPKVRYIIDIVLCTVFFVSSLHGIKNRSITEVIFDMLIDSSHYCQYSLAKPGDPRKNKIKEYQLGNESKVEFLIRKFKKKLKDIDEYYDSEDFNKPRS